MSKKKILLAVSLVVVLSVLTIFLPSGKKKEKIVEKNKKETLDYTIVDKSGSCESGDDEIYQDKEYIYYLECIKSDKIVLKYSNKKEIYLKDALKKKTVTIKELIKKGLDIKKKKIIETTNIYSNSEDVSTDSNNSENNSNNNKNNNGNSQNSNNSSNYNSSNSNSNNQTSTNDNNSIPSSTPKATPLPTPVPTPSCVSKKFDVVGFRPDFEDFASCQNKGNLYLPKGYTFSCFDAEDKCRKRYYMLRIYLDGVEKNFHNIPLN
jgi:hypothetical protein